MPRSSCCAFFAALFLLGQAAVANAQLPDFRPLVESASPAVVNVSTKQNAAAHAVNPHAPDITDVMNGPATIIGLRPGDVITHLANQAIDSTATFGRVTERLPKNRSVSMRVLREGQASFITFKLAD